MFRERIFIFHSKCGVNWLVLFSFPCDDIWDSPAECGNCGFSGPITVSGSGLCCS